MRFAVLGALSGDRPKRRLEIEFLPSGLKKFLTPDHGQQQQAKTVYGFGFAFGVSTGNGQI